MANNVIDLDKLEGKIRQSDSSFVAMCPACAEQGRNTKSKNHLRVWPDLRFNCVVSTGDRQHNARILQLVGTESTDDKLAPLIQEEIKPEIIESWPLDVLKGLVKDYSYFLSRGVSIQTQEFFGLGVAIKGYLEGRLVVPIFNEGWSRIIGFTGRCLRKMSNEERREYNRPRWKHKNKSASFLWPALTNEIQKSKSIILLEGPGDALYLFDRGIKNTLCLFGTVLSSKQLGYLIRLNPESIIIATNNELNSKNGGVGNAASVRLKSQLEQFFNPDKIKIRLSPLKDFNEGFGHPEEKKLLDSWLESCTN